MKRIAIAVFALISLAAHAMWVTGGPKPNPVAGTIIADTGFISGGSSVYTLVCASTVIARFEVAVRDAADTTDVVVQNFFVPANGNISFSFPIDVPPGGKIVIRTPASITGTVQGSILKEGPA